MQATARAHTARIIAGSHAAKALRLPRVRLESVRSAYAGFVVSRVVPATPIQMSYAVQTLTTPSAAVAKRLRFGKLYGSSDALALARAAQETRPLIVISASAVDARRLREEIAWFAPELRVSLFPDWETLPY